MMRSEGPLQAIQYTSRPALLLLLGCSAGLIVWALGWGLYGVLGLMTSALLLIVAGFIWKKHRKTLIMTGLYALLGACFALYSESRYSVTRAIPIGETLYSTDLVIRHPVAANSSSPTRYTAQADFRGESIQILLSIPTGLKIPKDKEYGGHFGATIDIQSLVLQGAIPSNPYSRYLLSEGYQATGTLQSIDEEYPGSKMTLGDRMKYLRAQIIRHFESQTTTSNLSDDQRGVLYALTLGERAYLAKEIKNDFKDSGLAHILAVSGYHLGIIYILLSWILKLIIPSYRYRRLRLILLFVSVSSYALICGASTATMRALLMSSIVILAGILDRPTDSIQALSLTVLILLMAQPLSYLNAGLVLSVSAVWGILVFLPVFNTIVQPSCRVLSYIGNLLFVCIAAQLGVLPFLLLYFQRAVFTILWSNIPAVLLSGILIPIGLLCLLSGTIIPIPSFLISILEFLLNAFTATIHFFGDISEGLTLKTEYDLVLVALYFGILHCGYLLTIRQYNRNQKILSNKR